ncbi:UbiA prenyltransferase family [Aspergillus spinulosporus]
MPRRSWAKQPTSLSLIFDLIQTSRYDRYMPYYTMFSAVWSTLIAGALILKEDSNSVSAKHIFTQTILTSIHCLLLCGAGNTWNDLVDRDIDAMVARTKARPLASGRVSTLDALVWMIAQYVLSVKILNWILEGQKIWSLMLPLTASIIVYPYLKRPLFRTVFIYPQYVLGFAVSYPAMIGWVSINRRDQSAVTIAIHCTPILVLVFFWCFYFNTAYSFQDSVDDRKMKINSAYLVAGGRIRLFLTFLGILTLVTIPFVVSKIDTPWLWLSWMGVWCGAIVKQIAQFDSSKPESGARIHWENFLLGLWTVFACVVEVIAYLNISGPCPD